MSKIIYGEVLCAGLKAAYFNAYEDAFDTLSDSAKKSEITWDKRTHGNQVSAISSTSGSANCEDCGKTCSLRFNFKKIEASEVESGEPVRLYETVTATPTIEVTGHQCSQDPRQR